MSDSRQRLSSAELITLRAAADTIIPVDEWPGGWSGGVERLVREHAGDLLSWAVPGLQQACRDLDAQSRTSSGRAFVELDASSRTHVLRRIGQETTTRDSLDLLVKVSFQGFYGGTREPAGWSMVGFHPGVGASASDPDPIDGTDIGDVSESYDVVIIGAGAGGGVAAAELSGRGRRVLLVERSRVMRNSELRGNHLQGKRAQLYDITAGPGAGSPRIAEYADGSTKILHGDGPGLDYGLVAMTLGGGTRVWQGMSWRFFAEDFAMASTYGVPEHSTLVDWPFDYDELAPYYDRMEWELGVSGASDSAIARRTPRARPYPMLPLAADRARVEFSAAAERLGWNASPIPFAINSTAREGRPACVRCHQCVGHSCSVDAKNGTHNTFIPRALATGNCDLLFGAQALSIEHDGNGLASGVTLAVEAPTGALIRSIRAKQVVIAAGAIETPRLLLASGLGNEWVGRNFQTHGGAAAIALDATQVKSYQGPGHSVATADWVHRDREAWGGGVIFDFPPMYPLQKAEMGAVLAGHTWGREHKEWMRTSGVLLGTMGMVQEIPHEASRVSLDPKVVDRWGMAVARIRSECHPATLAAAEYVADRCVQWVSEVGGQQIVRMARPASLAGAEHSAGTVRLADDPARGATDVTGRLFDTTNVFVADASLHPTNGGFNPGLTAMANAMRVADLMP